MATAMLNVRVGVVALFFAALSLLAPDARSQAQLQDADEPAPVTFKIALVAASSAAAAGTRAFLATYGTGDEEAKFIVEFDGSRVKGRSAGGAIIDFVTFSKGRFLHVTGSRPDAFLRAIAKALEAKTPRLSQERANVLPFDVAFLGDLRGSSQPGGADGWPRGKITTKLFLADGEAEVFFNFDPGSGDAEFSMKDEEYGNIVIEQLSKILW